MTRARTFLGRGLLLLVGIASCRPTTEVRSTEPGREQSPTGTTTRPTESASSEDLRLSQAQATRALCSLFAALDRDGDRRLTRLDLDVPRPRATADSASEKPFPFTVSLGDQQLTLDELSHASQLAQELIIGLDADGPRVTLDLSCVFATPDDYLETRIRRDFWDALTRRIDPDPDSLARALGDAKLKSTPSEGVELCGDQEAANANGSNTGGSKAGGSKAGGSKAGGSKASRSSARSSSGETDEGTRSTAPVSSKSAHLYVPKSDARALALFQAHLPQDVRLHALPEPVTPDWVSAVTERKEHGLLSLSVDETGRGEPFVVPGGRFNEMYGWDSFFIIWGILEDPARVGLARSMIDNHVYQIEHYGKILNANRTYYLTRSQPPFLSSEILLVGGKLADDPAKIDWLRRVAEAAAREWQDVWTSGSRRTPICRQGVCLSRYHGEGIGMPPEVEPGHYDWLIQKIAVEQGLCPAPRENQTSLAELARCSETLSRDPTFLTRPELTRFFEHDRCIRESGHDTTYRFFADGEEHCADFASVDLNSLLLKTELDLARLSRQLGPLAGASSEAWCQRARLRADLMKELMFDAQSGLFFDYQFRAQERSSYLAPTTLYPLWATANNVCDVEILGPEQAGVLIESALAELEAPGGLLASSPRSLAQVEVPLVAKKSGRGNFVLEPNVRQWEAPSGWAPHQMLVWEALAARGRRADAQRVAYRWLQMITKSAAEFHGTVPEKFDVVRRSHEVFAEYGNVGTNFSYIAQEGFGWMNASYLVGLSLLTEEQRDALGALLPPEELLGRGLLRQSPGEASLPPRRADREPSSRACSGDERAATRRSLQ